VGVEISPSKAIVDLYERNAAAWLADRGTDLHERPWLDRFAAPLPQGATILDVGCGSGDPIARYLIARGFSITGIDSSPTLVGIARSKLPFAEWIAADMRALQLDRLFSALLAWNSLFHLTPTDQRSMFARFAAHAAPGAMLMFTSGPAHGDEIGSWRGEPLYHGSLDPVEYSHLLDVHGFDIVDHCTKEPVRGRALVWLARRRE
jgi:SAM-dependent methyltransferase